MYSHQWKRNYFDKFERVWWMDFDSDWPTDWLTEMEWENVCICLGDDDDSGDGNGNGHSINNNNKQKIEKRIQFWAKRRWKKRIMVNLSGIFRPRALYQLMNTHRCAQYNSVLILYYIVCVSSVDVQSKTYMSAQKTLKL